MNASLLLDDSLTLSASLQLMRYSTVLVEAILVGVSLHHRVYFYPFTGNIACSLLLLLLLPACVVELRNRTKSSRKDKLTSA